jgi:adenylate cyclase
VHAAEIDRAKRKRTEDLSAYDLYLQALWDLRTITKESFGRCRRLLEGSLQRDPTFGDAWASLGDCIGRSVTNGWIEDAKQGKQDACDAAQRAIVCDPTSGTALALAAWAFAVLAGRVDQAVELARRALEIQPNSAVVRAEAGWAFVYSGEIEAALECFGIERRLDPINARRPQNLIGTAAANFFARHFEESERLCRLTVEETPAATPAWRFLAASLVHLGRVDDARLTMARLMSVQPNSSVSRTALTSRFRHEWMIELYLGALRVAGLPE